MAAAADSADRKPARRVRGIMNEFSVEARDRLRWAAGVRLTVARTDSACRGDSGYSMSAPLAPGRRRQIRPIEIVLPGHRHVHRPRPGCRGGQRPIRTTMRLARTTRRACERRFASAAGKPLGRTAAVRPVRELLPDLVARAAGEAAGAVDGADHEIGRALAAARDADGVFGALHREVADVRTTGSGSFPATGRSRLPPGSSFRTRHAAARCARRCRSSIRPVATATGSPLRWRPRQRQ